MVKNPPANAGDTRDARDLGLILGLGRSPGGGNGNPFQCSCLENSMDRGAGAWQATVHGVAKSQTMTEHTHTHKHIRSTDPSVSKAEIRPLPANPCSRPYMAAHCTRSSITAPQLLDALCLPPASLTSSHPLRDAAPLLWLVTLVSSSFLENAKLVSLRGHLHWLLLLLRTLFPTSSPGVPVIFQSSTSFVFCPLNSSVRGNGEASPIHPTSQTTDFNLGSNSSTQFQHYLPGYSQIPQVKGSVLLSSTTSDASWKSQLLSVLLTKLAVNQRFPHPPPQV